MLFDKNGDPWITIGPNYGFTIVLYVFVLILAIILYKILSLAEPKFWYFKLAGAALLITVFSKTIF